MQPWTAAAQSLRQRVSQAPQARAALRMAEEPRMVQHPHCNLHPKRPTPAHMGSATHGAAAMAALGDSYCMLGPIVTLHDDSHGLTYVIHLRSMGCV